MVQLQESYILKILGGNCFEKQVNSTWEHIDNSNDDYLIDNSIKIVKFLIRKLP